MTDGTQELDEMLVRFENGTLKRVGMTGNDHISELRLGEVKEQLLALIEERERMARLSELETIPVSSIRIGHTYLSERIEELKEGKS